MEHLVLHRPLAMARQVTRHVRGLASIALVLTSVTSFATPAFGQSSAQSAPPPKERYQDGIVIWETPPDDKVPFLLKFNINTQIRYLNTKNSDETFTDHLGGTREVHSRNDI